MAKNQLYSNEITRFWVSIWWQFAKKCQFWTFYFKNYQSFFLQNREKSKYHFLTFLPVTWVKIELQKGTIHQMNGWNLYFLAYFMQSIRKLNLRGPRTSDISLKFIESPFKWDFFSKKQCICKVFGQNPRISRLLLCSTVYIASFKILKDHSIISP